MDYLSEHKVYNYIVMKEDGGVQLFVRKTKTACGAYSYARHNCLRQPLLVWAGWHWVALDRHPVAPMQEV